MTGLWWWWWWMSMSRQDCNNRPRGSVMRSRMPAMGWSDVLTADATLLRNAATGTMTPLWRAASKGLTNPSEMLNTNPINRGRNKPAATNLCYATKPITHSTDYNLVQTERNVSFLMCWECCCFRDTSLFIQSNWKLVMWELMMCIYIEIRDAP